MSFAKKLGLGDPITCTVGDKSISAYKIPEGTLLYRASGILPNNGVYYSSLTKLNNILNTIQYKTSINDKPYICYCSKETPLLNPEKNNTFFSIPEQTIKYYGPTNIYRITTGFYG